MDKQKFFSALIMAVVLSVGTYYGLMYFMPYQPEELKLPPNPSPEEIFGGTFSPADPEAAAPAPADEAAAAPADAAGTAPVEEAAMDLASLADESPVQSSPESSAPTAEAPVAESAPEPAVEPEITAAPAEPEPTAEAAPAPEPVAAPAPAPKPAVKRYTGSREAAPPEVATKAWWGNASEGSLAVSYAGAASFKKAIALLFNGSFESAESVNQNVVVKNSAGKTVTGSWVVSATNKRMLTLDVEKSGTYTVTVKSGLTDQSGKSLANTVSGPVNIY